MSQYLRMLREALSGANLDPVVERVVFPPETVADEAAIDLLGLPPHSVNNVDVSTVAGLGLAIQGHDPLVESYLSRISGGQQG